MIPRRLDTFLAVACGLLFTALAIPFVGRLGLYEDEALFGNAVFQPFLVEYSARVFRNDFPLMLMSYVGTLKAILYRILFVFVDPSLMSVRLPMILAGAATVVIFFILVRDIAGRLAAILASLLLATDALFVLTTTFDWGPVALQHLLITGGALCLLRFATRQSPGYLAAGAFLFGLAIWDKALAVWLLGGLGVAILLVYPRELRKLATLKHLLVAIAAFALGAYPFLRYNLKRHGSTFTQGAHWSMEDLDRKIVAMSRTFEGNILLGWFASVDQMQWSFFLWLLAACVLLFPLCWRKPTFRPVIVAIVAFLIGWAQMLFTKEAGGSVHHTILLWPLPQFAVALILATCAQRFGSIAKWSGITAVVAVSVSNLIVLHQSRSDIDRFGPSMLWSHATSTLAKSPLIERTEFAGVTDWGISYTLHLLRRGGVPEFPSIDPPAIAYPGVLDTLMRDRVVIIRRVPGREVSPGNADALEQAMQSRGRVHETLGHVPDDQGKPLFEIYRYRSAP